MFLRADREAVEHNSQGQAKRRDAAQENSRGRRDAAQENSRGRSEARERRAPPPVGWVDATGRVSGRAGCAAYAARSWWARFRGRRSALARLASPPAMLLRRFAAPPPMLL